jgi:hypothetical protein
MMPVLAELILKSHSIDGISRGLQSCIEICSGGQGIPTLNRYGLARQSAGGPFLCGQRNYPVPPASLCNQKNLAFLKR